MLIIYDQHFLVVEDGYMGACISEDRPGGCILSCLLRVSICSGDPPSVILSPVGTAVQNQPGVGWVGLSEDKRGECSGVRIRCGKRRGCGSGGVFYPHRKSVVFFFLPCF